ncbi:MAG: beta-ketoacyl synthase chain length factor [Desulfobulbaceae bacterium]|nr:beta-ketoacyl synthase chain length factor [Desulfobulbaceae bacterium]
MQNALRRADDFIRLAVFVGARAIESVPLANIGPAEIGIFLGTTTGPLETNFRFLDTLFDDGEGRCSPTLFSHSVHNAAAGYLARLLNVQGQTLTMTSFGWPFLSALCEARAALVKKEVKVALVLGVEEESPVLIFDEGGGLEAARACRKGAVAWLLVDEQTAEISAVARLLDVLLEEHPCDPGFFFNRAGELVAPGITENCSQYPSALQAAVVLSKKVEDCSLGGESELAWGVEAPCGKASIFIDF